MTSTPRPTRAELEAARDLTIPDVAAPGLHVLFCGINPGLYSAATGYHFARPGNRFWPALHRSGFTPAQLDPSEQRQLLGLGLGITNVVARATARADELSPAELRAGGELLRDKAETLAPRWLAILGVTAFRAAFGQKNAVVGPQSEPFGATGVGVRVGARVGVRVGARVGVRVGARVWVLPNPSGLNAHWTPAALAGEFGRLRAAAG